MTIKLLAAAAAIGALVLPGAALAAERAIATTDVNLRAGPSTDYPAVNVVEQGDSVRVFGCLQTRSWCDVAYDGQRGWLSANYIAYAGRHGYSDRRDFDPYQAPVITFSIDSYWNNHYRGRDFYSRRDDYEGPRFHPRPDHWRDRRDARRDWRDDRRDMRRDRPRDPLEYRDYNRRDPRDDRSDFRRHRDDRGPDPVIPLYRVD